MSKSAPGKPVDERFGFYNELSVFMILHESGGQHQLATRESSKDDGLVGW